MQSSDSPRTHGGADSAAPFETRVSTRDLIHSRVRKIPYPLPMEDLVPSFSLSEAEVIDPFSGDYTLQSFQQDYVMAYLRDSISDKKNAWVLDKLESVLLFLDDLSVKKLTYRHILTSSLRFAKMNLSGSLLERFMNLNLFEFVKGEEESDVLLDDLTPQSVDTLEFFTMLRSNFLLTEGIISSPLYKKMKKLVFLFYLIPYWISLV